MDKLELLNHFFHPENITLIGVSRNLVGPSGMILTNILRGKYRGPLHLINKNVEDGMKILKRPVKRSLNEIDTDLDLVFVIVPSRVVAEVLEDCGKHNARAVVIISSGFAESVMYDREKLALQDELVKIARKNGFVFTGPNCNGIYSNAVSLSAIFGPRILSLPGNISYVTRGGTAGVHALLQTRVREVGVSKFINLGDAAGLELHDFIKYYGQDPETKVIGVYSEGINHGQQFLNIVRKVNELKPIIFYKSGETLAGQRAALSHVGAISGEHSSRIFQGIARQTGLILVESITELVDVCTSFMITHIPRGRNVGIVTPAGSLGVMASDACMKAGLNLPSLPPELLERIDRLLPEYWSHNNPVDLTDSMDLSVFGKIIKFMLLDDHFDGYVIPFGDFGDEEAKFVDFGFGVGDESQNFFEEFIKQQVKRMHKYIDQEKKPAFFLGPVQSNNQFPNFLRDHKVIVLPELRRIARTFAALASRSEYLKKRKEISAHSGNNFS